MLLHLTPEMLESQYELLKLTPPFRGWKLPPADDIIFKIINWKDREAHFVVRKGGGEPEIAISTHYVKTLNQLAQCLAHEMIHLHMDRKKMHPGPTAHNWRFKRFAKTVCRTHGWDLEGF